MKISTLYSVALLGAAQLISAQNCGPNIGSCAAGECCSQYGWCGTTPEHCGSTPPPPPSNGGSSNNGGSTRPRPGNVPYGTIIDRCTSPGKIALTYDDGPSEYTPQLLDLLASLNVKATFFITGLGSRTPITNSPWADIIRRAHNEGHHIANHGWAHLSLPSISYDAQRSEITTNENALQGILGFFPTYYRCPYLDCNAASGLPILNELGYHIIGVNADTKDYMYDAPDLIHNAMDIFASLVSYNPGQDSYINLAHDIREQTVVSLTRFMIETSRARGYELVTVGECLGDPRENWYRSEVSSSGTPSPPPPSDPNPGPIAPRGVSPNGLCAGSDGFTCEGSGFGDCCSEWGYCGSTDDFCAGGCNNAFGTCA